MPVDWSDPPSISDNSSRPSRSQLTRNDSLRSEPSDKRVSFNSDVGVKHIPRGLKDPKNQQTLKIDDDEWATCSPVHRERPSLSSRELRKEADSLINLLDQVDCISGSESTLRKHPAYTSQSLDRANAKKNKPLRLSKSVDPTANKNTVFNNERKNNLAEPPGRPPRTKFSKNFNNSRTTNQFSPKDSNLRKRQQEGNAGNRVGVRRSTSFSSPTKDSNLSESDSDHRRTKINNYKSVPDLHNHVSSKTSQGSKTYSSLSRSEKPNKTFQSVDNLYANKRFAKTGRRVPQNEFKSADNLTEITIPGSKKLQEYKPVENLQKSCVSSSNDIDMYKSDDYSSRVEDIIKKFNSESDDRVMTHTIYHEEPSSPRGVMEPNKYNSHNRNKPFSYTTPSPLSSVEAVRRISPGRDLRISKDDIYAKVNKGDRFVPRSISLENERNMRNRDTSDYSAKIIITSDPVVPRYDEDDHAYETFQVGTNAYSKNSRQFGASDYESRYDYKSLSNNNINMSSIGVQTDGYSRGPPRPRRGQKSLSPIRNVSPKRTTTNYRNDLESASLVRRINHGFGRYDRSPSPPMKSRSPTRVPARNVIPLLSDTEESEMGYNRKVDPLAKIRNQVMVREKLQEDSEGEERDGRYMDHRPKSVHNINSDLQPLTVDEVDALMLEVDKRGRNTLLVAREGQSNSTSRVTNSYNKKSETKSSRVHSAPPKERSLSPVTYRTEEKPLKGMSTLERMKNNLGRSGSTLEKKEKVDKSKDKKKKKIKIKFFYDPRPQDKPNEDPLEKFDEYRGSSYDDPERKEYYERDDDQYDYRNESTLNRRREVYEQSNTLTRETTSPQRPPRTNSRDRSREKYGQRDLLNNSNYNRDSSVERTMDRPKRSSKSNLRERDGSVDRELATLEKRLSKDGYRNEPIKEKYTNRDWEYNSSSFNRTDRRTERSEERLTKDNRRVERVNDSDSPDRGISLSKKYKNLTKKESPARNTSEPDSDVEKRQNTTKSTNREEKIMRQRKKFFGVLLGEGKVKSSSNKTPTSLTLPRPVKPDPHPVARHRSLDETTEREIEKNRDYRPALKRDWVADDREKQQWESVTLSRNELRDEREIRNKSNVDIDVEKMRIINNIKNESYRDKYDDRYENTKFQSGPKYSEESSPASSIKGPPVTKPQSRYFGDTDNETKPMSRPGDYRSLPNRKARSSPIKPNNKRIAGQRILQGTSNRRALLRGASPGRTRGSAGSSLQSSESEADSQGGSHASKVSRASRVSTSSNRSVYLHPTAVADIPVRRSSDESPSEKGVAVQGKKVTRSFSLATPWKPRLRRDLDYDGREYRERRDSSRDSRTGRDSRDGRDSRTGRDSRDGRTTRDNRIRDSRDRYDVEGRKSALPPRPPRRQMEPEPKRVGRSQTVYKDSKLAGWLRRRKNKESKGI